jgi:hypothetical protein
VSIAASSDNSGYASCGAGQVAIGGGAGFDGGVKESQFIDESGPTNTAGNFATTTTGSTPTQWYATFSNGTGTVDTGYVWVICA